MGTLPEKWDTWQVFTAGPIDRASGAGE